MTLTKDEISKSLAEIGLKKNDVVMIHGDAGPAAALQCVPNADKALEFIESIIDYFDEGTVIVPSFTYSATKDEIFYPSLTPSKVGLFSEKFRLMDGVIRSSHPIFSVGCFGHDAQFFADSLITDCFGSETLFDKLFLANGKILTIGCSLDRVTFVHYVEQKLKVSYRYYKIFSGAIQFEDKLDVVRVRYFVRDLNLATDLDLRKFEDKAVSQNKLMKSSLGRFPIRTISARDFFYVASNLLKTDPFALIREGATNE